jgi:hypothetical protein
MIASGGCGAASVRHTHCGTARIRDKGEQSGQRWPCLWRPCSSIALAIRVTDSTHTGDMTCDPYSLCALHWQFCRRPAAEKKRRLQTTVMLLVAPCHSRPHPARRLPQAVIPVRQRQHPDPARRWRHQAQAARHRPLIQAVPRPGRKHRCGLRSASHSSLQICAAIMSRSASRLGEC